MTSSSRRTSSAPVPRRGRKRCKLTCAQGACTRSRRPPLRIGPPREPLDQRRHHGTPLDRTTHARTPRGLLELGGRFCFRLIWGWSCQGAGVGVPVLVGRLERLVWSGVSGRRGVRVGATLGQPHMRDRGTQDLGSSQRPVSEIEPARWPGSQAKARTFVCARMPGPPRRLDTPEVMSLCYAVAISQQAPTSSRAIAMVTTPAGLPRAMRSRCQRACRRRCTRRA